jgi:pentatricopeptide repeat protein
MCEKALVLFEKMPFKPDEITLIILFQACRQLNNDRARKVGKKWLHQMPNDFRQNIVLLTSAMNMLIQFSEIENAEYLFRRIKKNNEIPYNCLMKGYNLNDQPLKSIKLFHEMKQENIIPDQITFLALIGACSQIGILSVCQSIVDQIPLHCYNKKIISSLIAMWVSVTW